MTSFKRVALIGKYKSPEIAEPLLKLARFVAKRGVEIKLDTRLKPEPDETLAKSFVE